MISKLIKKVCEIVPSAFTNRWFLLFKRLNFFLANTFGPRNLLF